MFLLERLVGVGVYSLLLVLVCFSLVGKSPKRIRRRLFLYSIILSVLAYNYVPYETADLHRIYKFVESFKKYSFKDFLQQLLENSQLSVSNIFYWLVGRIGYPKLLPAITSFICYSCIFYIIRKTAEKNQISGKNVAIALFFYMSTGTFIFMISGIRSMLGISILAFCFFRESAEKKFNIFHIFLYMIATFIHAFSAVLVAVRFVVPIFDKKTSSVKRFFYLVLLALGAVFVLRNLNSYIHEIIAKADSYLSGNMYSYVWDYIVGIITCFIILYVIAKYKTIKNDGVIKLNVFWIYLLVVFVSAICFCYEFSIFHRTVVYLLPIICLPFIMALLQKQDNIREKEGFSRLRSASGVVIHFNTMLIFVSTLLLLLSCARGSLSSFKFFVF